MYYMKKYAFIKRLVEKITRSETNCEFVYYNHKVVLQSGTSGYVSLRSVTQATDIAEQYLSSVLTIGRTNCILCAPKVNGLQIKQLRLSVNCTMVISRFPMIGMNMRMKTLRMNMTISMMINRLSNI